MGAVKKSTEELIAHYNLILAKNECEHVVIKLTQVLVKMSNGVTFEGNKQRQLISRIMAKESWHACLCWWFEVDTTDEQRSNYRKLKKKEAGSSSGKLAWVTEEQKEHNKNAMKGRDAWNKGTTGMMPPVWNKGLTKETSETIRIKISDPRFGENNPMVKRGGFTEEEKQNHSIKMKQLILDGEFTPKSNNRRTRKNVEILGRTFRSSWEAVFWYANQHMEYEKIRIKYIDENKKNRIYITDFLCENKLYEVGPQSQIKYKLEKRNSAISNGFEFEFITEKDILNITSKFTESDWVNFSEDLRRKLRSIK